MKPTFHHLTPITQCLTGNSGDDAHDLGLQQDLLRLEMGRMRRRQALGWLAAAAGSASGLGLVACGGGNADNAGSSASTGNSGTSNSGSGNTSSSGSSTCPLIPEETAGPYPGDGSNTANGSIANALALSGIVRRDIRSSIAGATATAAGVPLTLTLRLQNSNASCADLSGYAVYLWHCDRDGRYSMYSSGVTNENYLRGVQTSGSDGLVVFDTIFPGCYDGRMPHIHFEVYRSASLASGYANKLRTSQIAFPEAICQQVYSTASGYTSSSSNFARISFATDMVFSDGVSSQLASMGGSVSQGLTASLNVGVSA